MRDVTPVGVEVHALGVDLAQRLAELRVGLVVGREGVDVGALDHEQGRRSIALPAGLQERSQVPPASLGRRVGEHNTR